MYAVSKPFQYSVLLLAELCLKENIKGSVHYIISQVFLWSRVESEYSCRHWFFEWFFACNQSQSGKAYSLSDESQVHHSVSVGDMSVMQKRSLMLQDEQLVNPLGSLR